MLALVLALAGLWQAQPAAAHLLNMTRATLSVAADGSAQLAMQVDLQNQLGGADNYYRVCQLADPMQDAEFSRQVQQLQAAIQIEVDGQLLAWQLKRIATPKDPHSAFIDVMSWPLTQFEFETRLPAGSQQMRGRFYGQFYFSEPIALSMQSSDGTKSMSRWLVNRQYSPVFSFADAPLLQPALDWTSIKEYLFLGFTHILPQGYDHLMFVLGLLLASRSVRSLTAQVTLFTLAHSITLITVALGWYRLPPILVESTIIISIIWVGIENLRHAEPGRLRYLLTFCFGLVHGMGFAQALAEQTLPPFGALLALVSFNLGIELGQLSFIAACLSFWLPTRNRPWYRSYVLKPGSILIIVLASSWLILRNL